jgi:hypothetical protein
MSGPSQHPCRAQREAADLARLVKRGGLIADIKAIWRGRELPEGRQHWQL